jgi:hypothetical protein
VNVSFQVKLPYLTLAYTREKVSAMLSLLQLAVLSALVLYLAQRRAYMRRRNLQSWERLVAQIHSDSSAGDLGGQFPGAKFSTTETNQFRQQPHDFRGLWTLFTNARVALEMADYAERNSPPKLHPIDPVLLASLRTDAMQIRVSTLLAIAKSALHKSPA